MAQTSLPSNNSDEPFTTTDDGNLDYEPAIEKMLGRLPTCRSPIYFMDDSRVFAAFNDSFPKCAPVKITLIDTTLAVNRSTQEVSVEAL
jgi:hypothetical protein